MDKRLTGQVALVTGGGSGIGAGCALALAAEGAHVAVMGRQAEPLQKIVSQLKTEGMALPADVSDPEAVAAAVQAILQRWGRLDILVCGAGINIQQRKLDQLTPEAWNQLVNVNLNGVFYCVHAVLPTMRAQLRGTIIIVSSRAAYQLTSKGGAGYTAAKAGLNGLAKVLNVEEQPHGIRASVIYPGEVNTPILDRRAVPPPPERRAAILQPEDVAACVLLVATLPPRAIVSEMLIQPTAGEGGYGE